MLQNVNLKFRAHEDDQEAALSGTAPFRAIFDDITPEQLEILRAHPEFTYHHQGNQKDYTIKGLQDDGRFIAQLNWLQHKEQTG